MYVLNAVEVMSNGTRKQLSGFIPGEYITKQPSKVRKQIDAGGVETLIEKTTETVTYKQVKNGKTVIVTYKR